MEMTDHINESKHERGVERYFKMFKEHLEAYERNAIVGQVNGTIRTSDLYALGEQLEAYQSYQDYHEAKSGSLSDLGSLPNIALDVITATSAASIIPLLASTQPIPEQLNTVYYKKLTSQSTDGGVNEGDTLYDHAKGGTVVNNGQFGSAKKIFTANSPLLQTAAGTVDYTATLTAPILKGSLEMTFIDAAGNYTSKIMDDREGHILGDKATGTIDYNTGEVVLKFATDPAETLNCIGAYEANLELQDNLTTVSGGLEPVPIRANVFALQSDTGLIQDYSYRKRFGSMASDEAAVDLVSTMTSTLNGAVISQLNAAKIGNAVYTRAAPTGVAANDHKLGFIDQISEAENNILKNAGRGAVTRMVAGSTAAQVLRGMPNFTPAKSGTAQSISLYGDYSGIPVIRAAGVVGDKDIVCLFNGTSTYDTPLIYAPYLPLFQTQTMQFTNNPLRNTQAVATMVGIKTVIPNYITNIEVV